MITKHQTHFEAILKYLLAKPFDLQVMEKRANLQKNK